METVREKIAYLRGMIDASDRLRDEPSRIIFQKMLEVLDELATDVDELFIGQAEVEEYLEAIDEDLADLEDDLDDDCCCDHDHDHDHDIDDEELVEVDCPNCHEPVYFEEDFLYDDGVEVTCPDCGATVYDSSDFDDEDMEDAEVYVEEDEQ